MGEAKPLAQEDLNLTGEFVVRAEWGWGKPAFLNLTFVLLSTLAGNKRGGDVGCFGGGKRGTYLFADQRPLPGPPHPPPPRRALSAKASLLACPREASTYMPH